MTDGDVKSLIRENRGKFHNPDRYLDEEDSYPAQRCKRCGTICMNDLSPEYRVHRCPECNSFVREAAQEELDDFYAALALQEKNTIIEIPNEVKRND